MHILFFCLFNHTLYLFWWFYRKKWRTRIIHEVPKLLKHGKVPDGLYNCLSKGLRSSSCSCDETHCWNDVSTSRRLYLWLEYFSSSGAQINLAPYSSLSCMKSSTDWLGYSHTTKYDGHFTCTLTHKDVHGSLMVNSQHYVISINIYDCLKAIKSFFFAVINFWSRKIKISWKCFFWVFFNFFGLNGFVKMHVFIISSIIIY